MNVIAWRRTVESLLIDLGDALVLIRVPHVFPVGFVSRAHVPATLN